MLTVKDLEDQKSNLQAQLEQLDRDRVTAIENERNEKLAQISTHKLEADKFRNQANKATSDEESRRLYLFASDEDEKAKTLQIELGIYQPEPELEPAVEPDPLVEVYETKQRNLRRINSLLLRALIAFAGYFVSDLAAGKLDSGFFSFALKSAAQISFIISATFGGCWLVLRSLSPFASAYFTTDFSSDFMGLKPNQRLTLLAIVIASLFVYLMGVTVSTL